MVKIKDYAERPPSSLNSSARKFNDLATLTREFVGERFSSELKGDGMIRYVEPKVGISIDLRMSECQIHHGILIIPDINHLLVYSPIHYDLALRLAERYEQKTKEEFTLEKLF